MSHTIQTLLADWIDLQIQSASGVPVLFLSGAQGIGKSTALKHVEHYFDHRIAVLGLDDFYLTQAERKALAAKIHPLFEVRGPPGTHDIKFLRETIETLRTANASSRTVIPKFDKRVDDRFPKSAWTIFEGRPRAVLVEGWCIGALPLEGASDDAPLNAVEASDVSGDWRLYQEAQLAGSYAALWDQADAFFHLCAPSFEQVFDWRLQQEATTHRVAIEDLSADRKAWVGTFIQHYERLTKRMLEGHRRRGYALNVDVDRKPSIDQETPLIVFSDLDGTLLDHETYSFDAAKPALQALRDHNCHLVLASSKTAAEIDEIREQTGFAHCPAIVENGAGRLEPGQSAQSLSDGAYHEIRTVLDQVPRSLRQHFEGFGDLTAAQVAELTGLSVPASERAKTRCFSEPGRWLGPPEALKDFLEHLAERDLTARQGGRFLTFSFGATKADQMFKIASRFAPAPILALGDAPNDIEMLEAAHYAVIIKNEGGTGIPKLQHEPANHIHRTEAAGPTGWNSAVLSLMDRLGLDRAEKQELGSG